jgi:hypothetical protein
LVICTICTAVASRYLERASLVASIPGRSSQTANTRSAGKNVPKSETQRGVSLAGGSFPPLRV